MKKDTLNHTTKSTRQDPLPVTPSPSTLANPQAALFMENVKRKTYYDKPAGSTPAATYFVALCLLVIPVFGARAQSAADSVRLKEVQVTGYISSQPLLETPAAVGIL